MLHTMIRNLLFFSLIVTMLTPLHAALSCTYCIKLSYDPNDHPIDIKGTYKGDIIDLNSGIGFLPEKDDVSSFELIIVAEHPKIISEPVPHLERDPKVMCLWYDISWKKSGNKTVWDVARRPEESLPIRIPTHAIIICYPPEFIEKIDEPVVKESSGTIIHLPKIVLKKNLTKEERIQLDNQLYRSILANLEVTNGLSRAVMLVKEGNNVIQMRNIE